MISPQYAPLYNILSKLKIHDIIWRKQEAFGVSDFKGIFCFLFFALPLFFLPVFIV